jgi:hypothetical protein
MTHFIWELCAGSFVTRQAAVVFTPYRYGVRVRHLHEGSTKVEYLTVEAARALRDLKIAEGWRRNREAEQALEKAGMEVVAYYGDQPITADELELA